MGEQKEKGVLALSEGTKLNQHEGGRSASFAGGNTCAGPSLPFPCSKCPNYANAVIYPRKCYYGPQCGFGVIAYGIRFIKWRLRQHV